MGITLLVGVVLVAGTSVGGSHASIERPIASNDSAAKPVAATATACRIGPRADCRGADLRGANLRGKNLKKANLQRSDLRGADLSKANLKGANLSGANLKNATLNRATLRKATLADANLKKAKAKRIKARKATFSQARAPQLKINQADLRNTDWLSVRAVKGKFTKSDLGGANLRDLNARKASLRKAQAQGVDLTAANLSKATLKGGNFTDATVANTNFGGTNLIGTSLSGVNFDSQPQAVALPEGGSDIVAAIDGAQNTVDIVIYEIGGPNIVGQKGAPGALMRAVTRGVDVRLVVNGQWYNSDCYSDTPQGECAQYYKLDWIYATQQSLADAAASASAPGAVQLNFANNNFQVTHEKTIILDGADPDTGLPLAAADLPTSAQALISTGNLQSYGWGNDIDDPAKGCTENNCIEWAARDFFVAEKDPTLIAEVTSVFFSDLHCGAVPPGTTPSRTNTNGLLASPLPLTWSNGATWPQGSPAVTQYPDAAQGYPFDPAPGNVVQGNARERTLALINSAKSTITLYNEEMNDDDIVDALAARAAAGVDVKILMTLTTKYLQAFTQLADAGAKIRLTQVDDDQSYTKQLYVHAKVIVVDDADVFVGSQNISFASLNFNRELGLMLSSRHGAPADYQLAVPAMQTFQNTFAADWRTPGYLQWDITGSPKAMKAKVRALAADAATSDGNQSLTSASSGNYPMACGPIPARS